MLQLIILTTLKTNDINILSDWYVAYSSVLINDRLDASNVS